MASRGRTRHSWQQSLTSTKELNRAKASPVPCCSATTFRNPLSTPQRPAQPSANLGHLHPNSPPINSPKDRWNRSDIPSPPPPEKRTYTEPSTHNHPHSPPATPHSTAATAAPAIKARSPAPSPLPIGRKCRDPPPRAAGANRRVRRVPPGRWPRPPRSREGPGLRREPGGLCPWG